MLINSVLVESMAKKNITHFFHFCFYSFYDVLIGREIVASRRVSTTKVILTQSASEVLCHLSDSFLEPATALCTTKKLNIISIFVDRIPLHHL